VVELGRSARILLIDDHALFRESVARFLNEEPGLDVVAGCGTIEEAREILEHSAVDLVLLDFDLGSGTDWISCESPKTFGLKGRFCL
jgi:DNA-binding NarL/FixJ family response regulator